MQTIEDCLAGWAAPSRILNSDSAPDAAWSRALRAGEPAAAIKAFVAAMRDKPFLPDTRHAYIPQAERWSGIDFGRHGGHDYDPDEVIKQHYVGVYGIEHRFDGEIDWLYDPTASWGEHSTREWQVQFNRHYHWIPLARAWQRTSLEKYARAFERELISWVTSQCPAPLRKDMRWPGVWRTIEVGIRAGWTWPLTLDIMRHPDAGISDEAIWLMIAALHEHGRYLLMSPTGGNFKTMETNGLAHAGMLLPDLLDSEVFASTAIDRAIAEMYRQFYPDGCQDELASSYGRLSMGNTFCTLNLAQHSGWSEGRGTGIPFGTWERLRAMGEVYALIATPDGRVPGLHDCDGIEVRNMFEDMASLPADRADDKSPPWFPSDTVRHIPWGGYAMLRNQGRWSLLDAGPWGTGHQHSDALQVLTWADGDFWCIDPGKPAYNQSPETRLIRGAEGHNVVLMDGRRHLPDPVVSRTPAPLPMAVAQKDGIAVAAAGRLTRFAEAPETGFRHERVLIDIADLGWMVIDRLEAQDAETHGWEWLWHFPAGATVIPEDGMAVIERQDGAHLQVVATATTELRLHTVCGSKNPWRGWATAPGAAEAHPIPVLVVTSDPATVPVVSATLFASRPLQSVSLTPRHDGDKFTISLGNDRDPLSVTLEGEREWRTVAVQRSGNPCRITLTPHFFPRL